MSDRAAREADNPMRVILEASKLKVRIKPDAEPAAPAPKREAARPKAVAASAPVQAVAKAAAASASAADAPPAVAAAPASAPVAVALAQPSVAAPAPVRPVLPLKNIRIVEPELPSNVLRRLRGDIQVVVGFTVNTDGSVADVAVRSSSNKAVDDAVVDAVRQWRYEPVEASREHTVQLVLRGER